MFPVGEMALVTGGCVFLASLTFGVILTSIMHRLSWRLGALDRPDGGLKSHRHATATLGGVPFLVAAILGVGLMTVPTSRLGIASLANVGWDVSFAGLLSGAILMLLVGITDDIRHVEPRTKLCFQILAATIVISSGFLIRRCGFFGVFNVSLGLLTVPFTLFWLVGSCNALNFLDGLDGLVAGTSAVIAGVLAAIGFVAGAYGAAIASLAVCGALIGVLCFNVKPALIFLGDSGSQVIGLILGTLAIGVATTNGVFALPCAGLILSVPIIDTFLSVLRRYSNSASPAQGDHRHIHHCLRRHFTVRQTVIAMWVVVVATCAAGTAAMYLNGVWVGLAALTLVIVEVSVAVRLGALDLRLFATRLFGTYPTAISQVAENKARFWAADLEILWERMKPTFEQMKLDRAILTLEGVNADGRKKLETLKWYRSEEVMAALLDDKRWTRRFRVGADDKQVAELRLEAAAMLRRDEERIDWLLQQIRENICRPVGDTQQPEQQHHEKADEPETAGVA